VFDRFEVRSVIAERISGPIRDAAAAEGAPFRRIGLGDRFSLGPAEVEVLWPPPDPTLAPVSDRNARSVVLLVEIAGRRTLLTCDAEAELVPLDPGPLDVLKVAHHGSDDPGLASLLARAGPAVSLISAGSGNSYGHPVESTLSALEMNRSVVYRTDRDGSISVLIDRVGRITVETTG
jgi:competence protein ComEC